MLPAKTKLHKAFTLAELMVILAVMTVVIAAVAPILTSKYNTLMSTEVWHDVSADDQGDIYTDGTNHLMIQEIMIGLSPLDLEDIKNNYKPYAKLNIRSSDRVNGNIQQKPIEFYYKGQKQGYLAAGNENILLAGEYGALTSAARNNTAYGHNALNSLTGGVGNTAIGHNALSSVTAGNNNTAIGTSAGSTSNGDGNVYIGYGANANGNYNTIISNNNSVSANNTTAIGEKVSFAGENNVAIGNYADASGTNNTVVGSYAVSNFNLSENKTSNRSNNTAIGALSGARLASNAKNKTCIGHGGSYATVSGDVPQVFIGRGINSYSSPAAVVVNSNGANSSVVIYGNLIVRGQTYMYGQSPFPAASAKFNPPKGDALMGYTLYMDTSNSGFKPFVGLDGSGSAIQVADEDSYLHQVYGGKEACICTYTGSTTYHYLQKDGGTAAYSSPGIQAYDWSADFGFPNRLDTEGQYGYYYSGDSGAPNIELSRAHSVYLYGGSTNGSFIVVIVTSITATNSIANTSTRNSETIARTRRNRLF